MVPESRLVHRLVFGLLTGPQAAAAALALILTALAGIAHPLPARAESGQAARAGAARIAHTARSAHATGAGHTGAAGIAARPAHTAAAAAVILAWEAVFARNFLAAATAAAGHTHATAGTGHRRTAHALPAGHTHPAAGTRHPTAHSGHSRATETARGILLHAGWRRREERPARLDLGRLAVFPQDVPIVGLQQLYAEQRIFRIGDRAELLLTGLRRHSGQRNQ